MAFSRRSRRRRIRVSSASLLLGGQLDGLGQAHDIGHVFRARPAALFLVAADQTAAGRACLA